MENDRNYFELLSSIDVNSEIKSVQRSRYLPWTIAWAELKKAHPDATYEIHANEQGLPFFESAIGLFVKVGVTVNSITHTMFRPVYDSRNLAMFTTKRVGVNYGNKRVVDVEAVTAAEVNDAIMRCLTKAVAMHGLGLYIYQDKMYADALRINAEQIREITTAIAGSNGKAMLSELNAAFGIQKLSELFESNFEAALNFIKEKINE